MGELFNRTFTRSAMKARLSALLIVAAVLLVCVSAVPFKAAGFSTRRYSSGYSSGYNSGYNSGGYNSGYNSGSSTASSSSPAPSPSSTSTTITQKVTVSLANGATDYTGKLKNLMEVAYGHALGLWNMGGTGVSGSWKSGCSVSSTAANARRASVVITYTATVSQAQSSSATTASQALTSASMSTAITAAKADLAKGDSDYTSIASPTVSNVATPTISGGIGTTLAGAASTSASMFAMLAVALVCKMLQH